MPSPRRTRVFGAVAALAVAGAASAAIVFTTNGPFGGFFGLWGADLDPQQSAAARFIPSANFAFDDARIWLMNNSDSTYGPVTVRLEIDALDAGMGGVSRPSGIALEQWTFNIQTLGWNPVQHTMASTARPALRTGRRYWIVASSAAVSGNNPVWNFASSGNAYTAILQPNGTWGAGSSAALTSTVNGTPGAPLKGDMDRNGSVNAKDLAAFLSRWGMAQPAAGDADTNQDGVVNAVDLSELLANWS
jgi:hypothetical protein